jgi:hypothetical protein
MNGMKAPGFLKQTLILVPVFALSAWAGDFKHITIDGLFDDWAGVPPAFEDSADATDDSGSNPWDRLPSYWETEVALIEKLNRAAASNQPPVPGISRQANGAVQVNVNGAPGRFVLQASTNLTNWAPRTTNVSATGTFSIQETVATAQPLWTYRAEQ